MTVIHLPPHRRAVTPLFVMIDLQLEYLTEGRPHYLSGAHETFKNCARLLDKLRELRLPIAHFRQIHVGYNFNRASRFSQWAEPLRPRPSEYMYERRLPSCFNSADFACLMREIEYPEIVICGVTGERACLSTAIDAFNRDCRVTFVADCSASHALADRDEKSTHQVVIDLISVYGDIVSLAEIMRKPAAFAHRRG